MFSMKTDSLKSEYWIRMLCVGFVVVISLDRKCLKTLWQPCKWIENHNWIRTALRNTATEVRGVSIPFTLILKCVFDSYELLCAAGDDKGCLCLWTWLMSEGNW